MPVNKAVGDPDFAGTVNGEGSLMAASPSLRAIPRWRESSNSAVRQRNKSRPPSAGWTASPPFTRPRFSLIGVAIVPPLRFGLEWHPGGIARWFC